MGYCIEMTESSFRIKGENVNKVVDKIRNFILKGNEMRWVNEDVLLDKANGLYTIFEELRYPLIQNGDDYIIDYFDGEKLGDEFELFKYIADLIEPSYIEYLGEDGDRFRYVFDGKTCKEVYPKIEWE